MIRSTLSSPWAESSFPLQLRGMNRADNEDFRLALWGELRAASETRRIVHMVKTWEALLKSCDIVSGRQLCRSSKVSMVQQWGLRAAATYRPPQLQV